MCDGLGIADIAGIIRFRQRCIASYAQRGGHHALVLTQRAKSVMTGKGKFSCR